MQIIEISSFVNVIFRRADNMFNIFIRLSAGDSREVVNRTTRESILNIKFSLKIL